MGERAGRIGPRAFACVVLAAVSACSVVTSFDGLVPAGGDGGSVDSGPYLPPDGGPGGDAHGAPTDARTDAPVDAPVDAKLDARAGDGSSATDAPPDTGPPPSCDAGTVACGSTCANLQNDPQNCNRCGHDCLGGTCQAGVCQPVTLASMQLHPTPVLAVGTTLYWGNLDCCQGAVMQCALPSCAAPTPYASGQNQVMSLAADGTNLYWMTHQTLMACSLGSCSAATTLAGNARPSMPGQMAISSAFAYWASNDQGGTVDVSPLSGGAMNRFLQGCCWNPIGVAVVNGNVYYTTQGGGGGGDGIQSCPAAASCSVMTTVFQGLGMPVFYLATDGNQLFWTENNGAQGNVMSCAPSGCLASATIVAANQNNPSNIAADGNGVYWTNDGDRTVMARFSGGSPVQLAMTQSNAGGITSDATAVYWTDPTAGTINRVAKP